MQHKKLKQAFKINRRGLTGKCTIKKGRKKKPPTFPPYKQLEDL